MRKLFCCAGRVYLCCVFDEASLPVGDLQK